MCGRMETCPCISHLLHLSISFCMLTLLKNTMTARVSVTGHDISRCSLPAAQLLGVMRFSRSVSKNLPRVDTNTAKQSWGASSCGLSQSCDGRPCSEWYYKIACKGQKKHDGAPMPSRALQADQDMQLWKEIDDACSTYLSTDYQPQASSALEELCFLIMGFLQKPQGLDEKENTKRFLFHYSKTHDSGNSDLVSSVLHPLLQLVPQLNERRLKRYEVDEELQGPGGIQSRGYFFFRPRNGRRSVDFR